MIAISKRRSLRVPGEAFVAMLAALLLGFTAAGPASAKASPLMQECSLASNGGTLVNGVCVLPAAIAGGANDYFGYVIANNTERTGSDTFSVISGTLPPGLSMPSHYGATDTVINGVATQLGTFTFTVRAADPDEGRSSLQAYSITVNQAPPDTLVCSPDTNGGTLLNGVCVLPGATVGQPYEGFILTSNNSGGTFAIIAGSLPPGLFMPASYGASGTIVGGTPTQQGTFTFTVKGTDQQGQPLQQTYSITVGPPPPLAITFPTTCCNAGAVGQAYLQNFFLSGGVGPFTASIASGQLPPGFSLSASPPISITGTPTVKGAFTFTVKVTDSTGAQATKSGSITVS